ncbi:hypothetical protein DFP72DRAFT_897451 [Ephemerocybe angulata]|uniref:Uncharacterized protein n=1 Tax=Ephemerocybe angulata TaxID=980116 RepID=A0A8H6M7R2_9AGAR|nr:hypothetical protein DFP72DRAFT_897451 [Tulosesus angulatus]
MLCGVFGVHGVSPKVLRKSWSYLARLQTQATSCIVSPCADHPAARIGLNRMSKTRSAFLLPLMEHPVSKSRFSASRFRLRFTSALFSQYDTLRYLNFTRGSLCSHLCIASHRRTTLLRRHSGSGFWDTSLDTPRYLLSATGIGGQAAHPYDLTFLAPCQLVDMPALAEGCTMRTWVTLILQPMAAFNRHDSSARAPSSDPARLRQRRE